MRSTIAITASVLFLASTASAFADGLKIPTTYMGSQTLQQNSTLSKLGYVTNTPRVATSNNSVLTVNRQVGDQLAARRHDVLTYKPAGAAASANSARPRQMGNAGVAEVAFFAIREQYRDNVEDQKNLRNQLRNNFERQQNFQKQLGSLQTFRTQEQRQPKNVDAQLTNVDLQNVLQKQQQSLQKLSNISKMMHDTNTSTIRKLGP